MANLRKSELGRHRWIEGYQQVSYQADKRPILKCRNCAKTWDLSGPGDPPVVGCISDIDLGKLGKSQQADQLERDFRNHLHRPDHFMG